MEKDARKEPENLFRKDKRMKLYLVKLRGMQSTATGTAYGVSYVVAKNPTQAYNIVRKYVDVKDLGFEDQREMESIKLIAETGDYPECRTQLFIAEK